MSLGEAFGVNIRVRRQMLPQRVPGAITCSTRTG